MNELRRWLEITFMLVVLYLVLSRAGAFSAAVKALSNAYVGSVRALQGR